jgi:inositol phosphorylceramide mannosyltransferase catalytic subunit
MVAPLLCTTSYLRWILRLVLIISTLYIFGTAKRHIYFERFLRSSYITFNDFPPDYAHALKEFVEPPQYNHTLLHNESSIPPTIHFIWFKDLYGSRSGSSNENEIPAHGSNAPDTCRSHNPTYDIKVWDAASARTFLEEYYAWFLPTYEAYRHPIQRIDALKYFILFHFGGVYMDLDIGCRRSLDPLLDFPAWWPKASPQGVNNDLMAARPRHPILELMIESLERKNVNLFFPYLTVFVSTGPQFATDVLLEWVMLQRGRERMKETEANVKNSMSYLGRFTDILLRRRSNNAHDAGYTAVSSQASNVLMFSPGPNEFAILPQEFYSEQYTFFGHRPGGTWHEGDVAVVLWLVGRWRSCAAIIVIVPGLIISWRLLKHCSRKRQDSLCDLEGQWKSA